jgi:hypothetical protein
LFIQRTLALFTQWNSILEEGDAAMEDLLLDLVYALVAVNQFPEATSKRLQLFQTEMSCQSPVTAGQTPAQHPVTVSASGKVKEVAWSTITPFGVSVNPTRQMTLKGSTQRVIESG